MRNSLNKPNWRRKATLRLEPLETRHLLAGEPVILSQVPDGLVTDPVKSVSLELSEPVVDQDAQNPDSYQLLHLGADQQPGGGDDQVIPVLPIYATGSTNIELTTIVDLEQWREIDYGFPNGILGDWQVEPNGQSVVQTATSGMTFFVSDFDLVGNQFNGRMEALSESDDDFLGFVFGFQDDPQTGLPESYYLVSWKAADQGGAQAGLNLSKIANTGNRDDRPDLWNLSSSDPYIEVLASGPATPWQVDTPYDFNVNYGTDGTIDLQIRSAADGASIWETSVNDASPLGAGKIGFYNFSQTDVRYWNLGFADGLTDGHYQLEVISGDPGIRDAEGNSLDGNGDGTAGDNYSGAFEIDTAPATITLELDSLTDTGASNVDRITNNAAPAFSVTVSEIGLVELQSAGTAIGTTSQFLAEPGVHQFSGPFNFNPDGEYSVTAVFTPATGSQVQSQLDIAIDTAAPILGEGEPSADAPWSNHTLIFNEDIDSASLSLSDVQISDPQGDPIDVETISGSGNEVTVTFSEPTLSGNYTFVIGPAISDIAGNSMGQAESRTVRHSASPTITAVKLDGFESGFSDSVDRMIGWEFNVLEPLLVTHLGVLDYGEDGLLNEHRVGIWDRNQNLLADSLVPAGNAGELIDGFRFVDVADLSLVPGSYVVGATWPSSADQFVWDINLDSAPEFNVTLVTTDERIELTEGAARFNDTSADFQYPAKSDLSDTGFSRAGFWGPNLQLSDSSAPFVVNFSPLGVSNSTIDKLFVDFSEEVISSTFNVNDVTLTSLSTNTEISIASVTTDDNRSFVVELSAPLDSDGDYQVDIGPAILDPSGNSMRPLSGPTSPGYSAFFSIDSVGPFVEVVSPNSQVTSAVDHLDLTFSEPLSNDTLTPSDILIQSPSNTPVTVTRVTRLYGRTYRASFAEQRFVGTYSVSVGPDIQDAVGNSMLAPFTSSFSISLPDLKLTSAAPLDPATFGETVSMTRQVTNIGSRSASAFWSDRIWFSADDQLNNGDTLLGTFPTEFVPLGSGNDYTRTDSVVLPIPNMPVAGTYYLISETAANTNLLDADSANNALASPIAISLPSLPDLVVDIDSILAPDVVVPEQVFELSWSVDNVGSAVANGTWIERVFVSDLAEGSVSQLVGEFTFSDRIAPSDSPLLRTESITLPSHVGFSGDIRFIVEVDTYDAIIESNDENEFESSTTSELQRVLNLTIPVASASEGGGRVRATLTRSGSVSDFTTVMVNVIDPGHVNVPGEVTIPPGVSSVRFDIMPIVDAISENDTVVTITAEATGFTGAAALLEIQDDDLPVLSLSLPTNQLTEGETTTATLTRNLVAENDIPVTLTSSVLEQLDFPAFVTIPSGSDSVQFDVTATDDVLIESFATYSLAASSADHTPDSQAISISQSDVPTLSLEFSADEYPEGASGANVSGLITRDVVTDLALTVQLNASDDSQLLLPQTVVIPANQSTAEFLFEVADDGLVNGERSVDVTAAVLATSRDTAFDAGSSTSSFSVLDNDGPSLSISLDRDLLSEGRTTLATIRRNTDTTNSLDVQLLSGDESEATVQSVVTIPAGSATVDAVVTGVADGSSDGDQSVTISANVTGFNSGSATFIVTDINLPDLVVPSLSTLASGETGDEVEVAWEIRNSGIATAAGSWTQWLFISDDDQLGDDLLVGNRPASGPLAVDASLNQTATIRLPNEPGTYHLILRTDALDEIDEGFDTNNVAISEAIVVQPAYAATVSTNIEMAPADTPIPLTGMAKLTNGSPAPFVQVRVDLNVRGTTRSFPAISDENGQFALTFNPLPGEGGTYTVGASHPGVSNPTMQDTFELVGMRAEPASTSVRVQEAGSRAGSVALRNLSDITLTGLSVTTSGLPDNLTVDVSHGGSTTMLGMATLQLDYTVNATSSLPSGGSFTLHVASNEAPTVNIPVSYSVVALRSSIEASPGSLATSMLIGGQSVVEFEVTNNGGKETGPISILLPSGAPWLTLATSSEIDSLAPSESAVVTLLLTPAADLPLTAYNGRMIVRGSDSEDSIPFSFRAVSDLTGDLQVTVVDEFFYFTEEKPTVTGATVVLRDAITGLEIASSKNAIDLSQSGQRVFAAAVPEPSITVDGNGQVTFGGLPEGPYTLEVRSPDHETYANTIRVRGGEALAEDVFISRNLVEYIWTVEEVEVEDRTRVTIESVFETNVPAPVITIDNGLIDLAELTEIGQTMQVDMTITNHGLIAANDITFDFGTHPFYEITPLIREIGTLPAKSELTVPVIVRRIGNFDTISASQLAAMNGAFSPFANGQSVPCDIFAIVIYSYDCGPNGVIRSTPIAVINVQGTCKGGTPSTSGSRGPGASSGPSRGGPGGVAPVSVRPTSSEGCTECVEREFSFDASSIFGGLADYVSGFLNGKMGKAGLIVPTFSLDANIGARRCCEGFLPFSLFGNASGRLGLRVGPNIDVSPSISFTTDRIPGAPSIDPPIGVTAKANLKAGGFFEVFGEASGEVSSSCHDFSRQVKFDAAIGVEYFGGVEGSASLTYTDPQTLKNVTTKVEVQATIEGKVQLEAHYRSGFGAGGDFEEGWTVDFCSEGIYIEAYVDWFGELYNLFPEADDPNTPEVEPFYLADPACVSGRDPTAAVAQPYFRLLQDAARIEAIAQGIVSPSILPFGHVAAALPDDGACARVRIQIEQDIVLTRTAFEASLQLLNSSDSIGLQNLEVQLHVYNVDGQIVNSLFAVGTPELTGVSSIDGSGALQPNGIGSIGWLLVPTEDAALESETEYSVGGFFSYSIGQAPIVVTLEPVTIMVKPDAALDLKYFHQRDVISDDPFTSEIESAEPFTLGVMVKNNGAGQAKGLRIESAQPKIVENEKGLLIDFEIVGTRVNGMEVERTLTADFGDLAAGGLAIAEWYLESTLQGLFIEYDATFEHISPLNDPKLSLVKSVEIHELIRSVDGSQQQLDAHPDFLANDLPDPFDTPDTLHLSDGSIADVGLGSNASFVGTVSMDNLQVDLTVDMDTGWQYLGTDDPSNGEFILIAVERSDGTPLPVKNFWQSDRTFIGGGRRPILEDKLHLLDYNSTGSYTLTYSNGDLSGPSILEISGVDPNPTNSAIDQLTVTFDEPIELGTFDHTDLQLRRDNIDVPLTDSVTVAHLSGSQYQVSGLASLTVDDAVYQFVVDSRTLTDQVGNAGERTGHITWVKGEAAPAIIEVLGLPNGVSNTPPSVVEVVFTETIQLGSFRAEDLSVTRNGNELITGASGITILQNGDRTYQLSGLETLLVADGQYVLTVNAEGISDLEGNSGLGSATSTWILDSTAPRVTDVIDIATNPRNIVVQQIDIEFSEPIDMSTLDVNDLRLTRDGGLNLIDDDDRVTFEHRFDSTYRVRGINWVQPLEGLYEFTIVGDAVNDPAGNPAVGSASANWEIDLTPPNPPSNLRLETFSGPVTNIVNSFNATLTGILSEPGLTVAVRDMTTDEELIRQTFESNVFSLPITFPTVGDHEIRIRAIDEAGNVADSFIDDLFVTESPAPRIIDVRVRSSDWNQRFIDFVDSDGIGFPVPHGSDQLKPLPWTGMDQILIEFNTDVRNVTEDDVQLLGVNVADYESQMSVEYDDTSRLATLTFSHPLSWDKLRLIVADTVVDGFGNALNGEWADGNTQGRSGDGDPGGVFEFRMNIAPGSTDQSFAVAVNDIGEIRTGLGSQAGDDLYSIYGDLNGSGGIAVNDAFVLRDNLGVSLPTGEPLTAATPPSVAWVKVGSSLGISSDWSTEFLANVDRESIGYQIPNGFGQLSPLPWNNIRQLFVKFNKNVRNVDASNIHLLGVNVAEYALDVQYDSATQLATLTAAEPIGIDKLQLVIQDIVSDERGLALDGDWADGRTFGTSGDGDAGGDFEFRINVVPGDADGSGGVSVSDAGPIRDGLGLQVLQSGYSIFADFDGSGAISVRDIGPLRANLGDALPSQEPAVLPLAFVAATPAELRDDVDRFMANLAENSVSIDASEELISRENGLGVAFD